MKNWKIEVYYKPDITDTIGQGILEDITDLGISGVESVRTAALYWIEGNIDAKTIEQIGAELLADPITQLFKYHADTIRINAWTVEVQFKPGVTDAVGDSTVKGITDIGICGVDIVRTGQKYWLDGTLDEEAVQIITQRLLMNDVIQTYSYQEPKV